MALDGPKDGDQTFDDKGLTFVMESELYDKVKPVTVEFITSSMGTGFRISSSLASGGACGSSCSCG
jgi:Fe-S cluster assembly iron-binding protein IscA